MKGKVFKSTGLWYDVVTEEKLHFLCRLRGKIKLKGIKTSNPIAVGDIVSFEPENDVEGQGVITSIESRDNYIIRKATRLSRQSHILASNLDQAVLIVTHKNPKTSLGFIDRFLVSAESFRIPVILFFNKSDLLEEKELLVLQDLLKKYNEIGYPGLIGSVKNNSNLDKLKEMLFGKTTLLAGHSGVGKSSLLNVLIPDINQKTAEISPFADKGVHTTTYAEMFKLDDGSFLIDTPGVKELGLFEIGKEELSHYFPEMREHLGKCKFGDCSHTHEPGCYITDLLESGEIVKSRYESYLSMREEDDNRK